MTKQKKFYLQKFKGKIFVLKIGGEVIASKSTLESILKDVRDLQYAGVHVVLVHGGGSQADALAKQLGYQPIKVAGRRVTSAADVEMIKMLYGGTLNLEILSIMKKIGVMGIRMSGLDGNLLQVKLRSKKKIDYGLVGDITGVNPRVLKMLIREGCIPVVSPIAVTNKGVIVNINADTIATELAIALAAEKLILFTNVNGISDGHQVWSVITESEAKHAIHSGTINNGMAVKVENCLRAIKRGVRRVHIINGLSPHSLMGEVLTKKGVGTMVVSDSEKNAYAKE